MAQKESETGQLGTYPLVTFLTELSVDQNCSATMHNLLFYEGLERSARGREKRLEPNGHKAKWLSRAHNCSKSSEQAKGILAPLLAMHPPQWIKTSGKRVPAELRVAQW